MYVYPYQLTPLSMFPGYNQGISGFGGGGMQDYGGGGMSGFGGGGLSPQGLFGGALGSLLGSGIGGLFGGSGSSIGGTIGGIAGGLLPFSSGPSLAVAGAEPGAGDAQAAQKPVLLPQSFLDPDAMAKRHLLQAASKGLIDKLMEYLSNNKAKENLFAEVVPLVQRAMELYKANDFQRSVIQAYLAFHTLETIRAKHPDLSSVFA
jgi:hypothetical protein